MTKYRMPSLADSDNVLLVFTTFAFTLASAGPLPPSTKSGFSPTIYSFLTTILNSTFFFFHLPAFSQQYSCEHTTVTIITLVFASITTTVLVERFTAQVRLAVCLPAEALSLEPIIQGRWI